MTGDSGPRDLEDIVRRSVDALPATVRDALSNVAFVIEQRARPAQAREVGIEHGHVLLGLYHGVALTERSSHYSALPDKITIFEEPCARGAALQGVPLEEFVRETVWHEVGHHLGLDDEQLEALERERQKRTG